MNSGVFTIPLVGRDDVAGSPLHDGNPGTGATAFIAGPENQLLRPFLELVTTTPPLFNPITLFGPTGVGKSHLAVGLAQRAKRDVENTVALYTGADFGRGYARAVEVDSISEWRERLRNVELLIVDNLEELATKPAAQQELIGTLDALIDQDRQVVFTTRDSLFDWNWMLPGLRSRLVGGLTIPITHPAPATQEAIWRELRRSYGLSDLPAGGHADSTPERSNYVDATDRAEASGRSRVRSRSHARPRSFQQLRKQLWAELQATAHVDEESSRPPRKTEGPAASISLAKIGKAVARHCQVRLADLSGSSRRQTLVQARGMVIVLARSLLGSSFEEIGEHLGGRDHTTILHSWRKTSEGLQENPTLRHDLEKLSRQLTCNFEIDPDHST